MTASQHGTVTVSMPFYQCHQTIRRAVTAVLDQTYRDLQLVVVVDGDPRPPLAELSDVRDKRLHVVTFAENRGRYFCDAAVLAATAAPWFAIHDADDHAEPEWLATLLDAAASRDADAAFAPQHVHTPRGGVRLEPVKPMAPLGERMEQLAHHAGVYRTAALRKVGIHPGFRVGYDTLLVNLLAMTGRVATVDVPLYHRVGRRGSLTTAPRTRFGSSHRAAAARRLQQLFQLARQRGPHGVVAAHTAGLLAGEVSAAAARIRQTVGPSAPTAGPLPPPAGRSHVSVVDRWPTGPWVLPHGTALELAAALERDQPSTILEAGSGASTVLLAEYAARHPGTTVVSLEQDRAYAARTAAMLQQAGLADAVQLHTAPLTTVETPSGRHPWYDHQLPGQIDLALIDGPTEASGGREAALHALWPHLAPGWQVWLDDADRRGERQALAAWQRHHGVAVRRLRQPHGLAVVTAEPPEPPKLDASSVAVTLLTGRRPQLFAATVTALAAGAPELLESAHVTVLHNGGDKATAELLDSYPWIDRRLDTTDWLPVGRAVSWLVAATEDRPYVLHLEDDWSLATLDPGWLDAAVAALADPKVGQVRLRHRGEKVLGRHMITGRPIVWTPTLDERWAIGVAHFTLNPSLMRREDLVRLWPAIGERQAAQRFHRTGLRVAQLNPGAFVHTGGKQSLEGHRW